jgi:hypothetical protein
MIDASMSYGEVSGLWAGGSASASYGGFETGTSIAARDAERGELVLARIDGKLALSYLQQGDLGAANRIFRKQLECRKAREWQGIMGCKCGSSGIDIPTNCWTVHSRKNSC